MFGLRHFTHPATGQQRSRFCRAGRDQLVYIATPYSKPMQSWLILTVRPAESASCSLASDMIAFCKQIVYIVGVIKNFAGTETERLFATGKSRRLPPDILSCAVKRLTQLDAATTVEDLRMPPSNRLESLSGNRTGQWSIRINDQWRLCFRFGSSEALDVEIVDYH